MNSLVAHLDPELRRVLWACYVCWKAESPPPEQRLVCYTRVADVYSRKLGGTFHQSRLQQLAEQGLLTSDDAARGGHRRYYRISDSALVERLLAKWGLYPSVVQSINGQEVQVCGLPAPRRIPKRLPKDAERFLILYRGRNVHGELVDEFFIAKNGTKTHWVLVVGSYDQNDDATFCHVAEFWCSCKTLEKNEAAAAMLRVCVKRWGYDSGAGPYSLPLCDFFRRADWYAYLEDCGLKMIPFDFTIHHPQYRWLERSLSCGGPPFCPIAFDPGLRSPSVLTLARGAYEERSLPAGTLDNARLAVLADLLEEGGYTAAELLAHLRSGGEHLRGCWALDLVLNEQ
jgi:hypothetical protein